MNKYWVKKKNDHIIEQENTWHVFQHCRFEGEKSTIDEKTIKNEIWLKSINFKLNCFIKMRTWEILREVCFENSLIRNLVGADCFKYENMKPTNFDKLIKTKPNKHVHMFLQLHKQLLRVIELITHSLSVYSIVSPSFLTFFLHVLLYLLYILLSFIGRTAFISFVFVRLENTVMCECATKE